VTPDSPLVQEVAPSPSHDARADGAEPSILLLHYTGMRDGASALARLRDPQSKVSCHYLIEEGGRIVQLVPEALRAWHAGAGSWRGQEDVNSRSIGIEIVNPGHEHGYRAFPSAQVAATVELCKDCVARWPIAPDMVLAHSDTAPSRKRDPGELFPWDQLFSAGIGLWVEPAPIAGGRFLTTGDRGQPVEAYQALLATFGYGVAIDGIFDDRTRAATIAFQRHFRPARVDGVADGSTIDTLYRLTILQNEGRLGTR
jgi:N-acetylmuramoyl-L-alanine amidase